MLYFCTRVGGGGGGERRHDDDDDDDVESDGEEMNIISISPTGKMF